MPREAGVITLRRAEPSDFEGICETFRDESAYSGTLQLPYPCAEIWRKRIADYRKFGFEVEGTHREYALRAGRYADTLAMARIKHKT